MTSLPRVLVYPDQIRNADRGIYSENDLVQLEVHHNLGYLMYPQQMVNFHLHCICWNPEADLDDTSTYVCLDESCFDLIDGLFLPGRKIRVQDSGSNFHLQEGELLELDETDLLWRIRLFSGGPGFQWMVYQERLEILE